MSGPNNPSSCILFHQPLAPPIKPKACPRAIFSTLTPNFSATSKAYPTDNAEFIQAGNYAEKHISGKMVKKIEKIRLFIWF